ncbi:MAG: hypothetical protein ACRDKE_08130 [Solirubrobacterales bacterium]
MNQHDTSLPLPDGSDEERLAATIALYDGERQDLTSLMGHSLTLVGLLIAYAAAASGLLSNGDSVFSDWYFAAIAALPAWITLGFHTTLIKLVFAHSRSAVYLEDQLALVAGIRGADRDKVGARAGELATNIATQRPAARGQTLVTYVGIAVLIIFFTVYCISVVAQKTGRWGSTEAVASSVFYLGLIAAAAAAWIEVLKENEDNQVLRVATA